MQLGSVFGYVSVAKAFAQQTLFPVQPDLRSISSPLFAMPSFLKHHYPYHCHCPSLAFENHEIRVPFDSSSRCGADCQALFCAANAMSRKRAASLPVGGNKNVNKQSVYPMSFDDQVKYIGSCECRPLLVSLLLPKMQDEPYPRCDECLKFYDKFDWTERHNMQVEKREAFRRKQRLDGHPLYQDGARFAPGQLRREPK